MKKCAPMCERAFLNGEFPNVGRCSERARGAHWAYVKKYTCSPMQQSRQSPKRWSGLCSSHPTIFLIKRGRPVPLSHVAFVFVSKLLTHISCSPPKGKRSFPPPTFPAGNERASTSHPIQRTYAKKDSIFQSWTAHLDLPPWFKRNRLAKVSCYQKYHFN